MHDRKETNEKTGIICSIYRNNYSNGGTLREKTQVCLMVGGPCTPDNTAPAVKLVKRHLFGKDYFHAEPVDKPAPGYAGYMAGGTLLYSSDSRFREICDYAIVLHDHVEVPDRNLD